MSDIAQMQLFSTRIVPVGKKRGTIPQRFSEFHKLNAHVYVALVMLAREYREHTGRTHVGIKMLWEKLRYEFGIRTSGDSDYALNNDFTSYYARLIAEQEPDLADAFEFRRLRSKAA